MLTTIAPNPNPATAVEKSRVRALETIEAFHRRAHCQNRPLTKAEWAAVSDCEALVAGLRQHGCRRRRRGC